MSAVASRMYAERMTVTQTILKTTKDESNGISDTDTDTDNNNNNNNNNTNNNNNNNNNNKTPYLEYWIKVLEDEPNLFTKIMASLNKSVLLSINLI
jgi:hypothetical protein